MDFVEVLKAQQERDRLSQSEFAEKIGVSAGYLSLLYHGKREPGVNLLSRVRRTYPHLASEIDLFLSQKSTVVMAS